MRVPCILLITLVVFVNSIVCVDDTDVKHLQFGAHPTDFSRPLKTISATPYENAHIRVLHDDESTEPKEVTQKMNMIARGKTIIGHDGGSRGFYDKVYPIFNTKGVICFQHKDDRSKTWPVPYNVADKWGLMAPTPNAAAYLNKNPGLKVEDMNYPVKNENDKRVLEDTSDREDVKKFVADPARTLRVIQALKAALPPEYRDGGSLNSGGSGKERSRSPIGRPEGSGEVISRSRIGRPKGSTTGTSSKAGVEIIKRPIGRPKGSTKGKGKAIA